MTAARYQGDIGVTWGKLSLSSLITTAISSLQLTHLSAPDLRLFVGGLVGNAKF